MRKSTTFDWAWSHYAYAPDATMTRERAARKQTRDLTRYDVKDGGQVFANLPKRPAIFQVVGGLM